MRKQHTYPCPEAAAWAAHIADWDTAPTPAQAAHWESCAACAQAAAEMNALRHALHGLPVRQTSPHFEANLSARLQEMDRQRAPRLRFWQASAGQRPQFALRPALALAAMTAVAVGTVFFGHLSPTAKTISIPTPPAQTADFSLVAHCVEQTRTEAAAQPLSDLSAQNLAAHADTASAAGTPASAADLGAAGEDGL